MAIPLTGFAAGAVVALLVGVFGKVHDPTLAGTTTLGLPNGHRHEGRGHRGIGVLAVLQLIGALWMYGKLGQGGARLARHRTPALRADRPAAVVFVAYHCSGPWAWSPGRWRTESRFRRGPSCTASSAAPSSAHWWSRWSRSVAARPGWFLPVAEGLLFALLVAVGADLGSLVPRRQGLAGPQLSRLRLPALPPALCARLCHLLLLRFPRSTPTGIRGGRDAAGRRAGRGRRR